MNHELDDRATPATVLGPFHIDGSPELGYGEDMSDGLPGVPLFISGTVVALDGSPVGGAVLDVWQADQDGFYDVQYQDSDALRARGVLTSDAEGRVRFRSVLPVAYPVPTDGPVGQMLVASGRHPWRPAHLHFMIQAPGCETLITHVFRDDDPYLDSDVVFGVRASLIGDYRPHAAGTGPHAREVDGPYHTLDFDFVLQRRDESAPAAG
jgi:hydroxyquinol 1,2-dioxygenase